MIGCPFSAYICFMIVKKADSFLVYDSKGKKLLGKHKTRREALAQQAAIEISKAKRNA